jgi:hypothetical protein
MPAEAQDIKVKSIKKIPIEKAVQDYSFGEKSHKIILTGPEGQSVSQYNTRLRRLKLMPEPETKPEASIIQTGKQVRAKAAGRKIEISTPEGGTRTIAPVGEYYYIWISLSPDGKRLLFNAVGKGSFISDLEGNILVDLGKLNAPAWIDEKWVLGMDDKDDGHQVTSSEILSVHTPSGIRMQLSEGTDEIALYPKVSPAGDRIVFQNGKGEIFTMKIKIKE